MGPIKSVYWRKGISLLVMACFIVTSLNVPYAQAQEFTLPKPGVMVHLSPEFNPPILKGIKVHPDNPFRFEFILDQGDDVIPAKAGIQQQEQLKTEATRLIKYFLASLTIPEKDLWVNLSPYEKDRIVPESFGQTEMGRDLLAQDYLLKQITASLIYPEDELGKKFWKRVYEEAQKKYGTTQVPVNTFNKVWIVPEKAVVYENAKAGTAYVVESKLKVMLEEDYLSLEKNTVIPAQAGIQNKNDINSIGSQIVREIVIPQLTKEINEGKNFAQLRQVYQSLILATWYKKKIKDSILSQVYADKNKVVGINIDDPQEKQKIYQQYLQAFKKGVYNYIKEEQDPLTQETVPKKYFSGGVLFQFGERMNSTITYTTNPVEIDTQAPVSSHNFYEITSEVEGLKGEQFLSQGVAQGSYGMDGRKTDAVMRSENRNQKIEGSAPLAGNQEISDGAMNSSKLKMYELRLNNEDDLRRLSAKPSDSFIKNQGESVITNSNEDFVKVVSKNRDLKGFMFRGVAGIKPILDAIESGTIGTIDQAGAVHWGENAEVAYEYAGITSSIPSVDRYSAIFAISPQIVAKHEMNKFMQGGYTRDRIPLNEVAHIWIIIPFVDSPKKFRVYEVRLKGMETKAGDAAMIQAGEAMNAVEVEDEEEVSGEREEIFEELRAEPQFARYLSDEIVHIQPGYRISEGGYSLILLDSSNPGDFYKIAQFERGTTRIPSENEVTLNEANVLIKLNALASKGLPQLMAMGVNHNGAVWLKLKGIANGQNLNSKLWKSFSPVKKIEVLIRAAQIFQQINDTSRGHNDIKLGNILVNEKGEVMVIDFGIAGDEGEGVSAYSGSFAPSHDGERRRDSDVYSFGKTLEELFLGKDRKQSDISAEDMRKSGLKNLIENMSKTYRKERKPADMKGVVSRLQQIKKYFEAKMIVMSTPAEQVVPLQDSEYEIASVETTYDLKGKYSSTNRPDRRDGKNLALKMEDYFDYLRTDVVSDLLGFAFENAAGHGERNDYSTVEADIKILKDEIVVRIFNDFDGELPREINGAVFDSSSDNIEVPWKSRDRAKGGYGIGVPHILNDLKYVYSPRVQTTKRPSVRWSMVNKGKGKKVLFELRIPMLTAEELKARDLDKISKRTEKIKAAKAATEAKRKVARLKGLIAKGMEKLGEKDLQEANRLLNDLIHIFDKSLDYDSGFILLEDLLHILPAFKQGAEAKLAVPVLIKAIKKNYSLKELAQCLIGIGVEENYFADLMDILKRSITEGSLESIGHALQLTGSVKGKTKEVLPIAIKALAIDKYGDDVEKAIIELKPTREHVAQLITILNEALGKESENYYAVSHIAAVLGSMKEEAKEALPVLINSLRIDTYEDNLADAIIAIKPNKDHVAQLAQVLRDANGRPSKEYYTVQHVFKILKAMGKEAAEALPTMIDSLRIDKYGDDFPDAIIALGPSKEHLPLLMKVMREGMARKSEEYYAVRHAAKVLGSMGQEASSALPLLIEALTLDIYYGDDIADAIIQIGIDMSHAAQLESIFTGNINGSSENHYTAVHSAKVLGSIKREAGDVIRRLNEQAQVLESSYQKAQINKAFDAAMSADIWSPDQWMGMRQDLKGFSNTYVYKEIQGLDNINRMLQAGEADLDKLAIGDVEFNIDPDIKNDVAELLQEEDMQWMFKDINNVKIILIDQGPQALSVFGNVITIHRGVWEALQNEPAVLKRIALRVMLVTAFYGLLNKGEELKDYQKYMQVLKEDSIHPQVNAESVMMGLRKVFSGAIVSAEQEEHLYWQLDRAAKDVLGRYFSKSVLETAFRAGFKKVIVKFESGLLKIIFIKDGQVETSNIQMSNERLRKLYESIGQNAEVGSAWSIIKGYFPTAMKQELYLMRERVHFIDDEVVTKLDAMEDVELDGTQWRLSFKVEADEGGILGQKMIIDIKNDEPGEALSSKIVKKHTFVEIFEFLKSFSGQSWVLREGKEEWEFQRLLRQAMTGSLGDKGKYEAILKAFREFAIGIKMQPPLYKPKYIEDPVSRIDEYMRESLQDSTYSVEESLWEMISGQDAAMSSSRKKVVKAKKDKKEDKKEEVKGIDRRNFNKIFWSAFGAALITPSVMGIAIKMGSSLGENQKKAIDVMFNIYKELYDVANKTKRERPEALMGDIITTDLNATFKVIGGSMIAYLLALNLYHREDSKLGKNNYKLSKVESASTFLVQGMLYFMGVVMFNTSPTGLTLSDFNGLMKRRVLLSKKFENDIVNDHFLFTTAHELAHMLELPGNNYLANGYALLIANRVASQIKKPAPTLLGIAQFLQGDAKQSSEYIGHYLAKAAMSSGLTLSLQEAVIRKIAGDSGLRNAFLVLNDGQKQKDLFLQTASGLSADDYKIPLINNDGHNQWAYIYGSAMGEMALEGHKTLGEGLLFLYQFGEAIENDKKINPNILGVKIVADKAQTNMAQDLKGGIDLTSDKALQVENSGEAIKFNIDPAMLEQLQNAPGFTPVIINIQPMTDLRLFLGLTETSQPLLASG